MPTPIFSKKSVAIVPKEFDGQICSTGFKIIENNSLEEAIVFFGIFKSLLMQKQMYYIHSGSAQPNVSSRDFKEKLLVPIPKGKWRDKFFTQTKNILENAKLLRKRYFAELQKSQETFEKLVYSYL